MPLTTQIKNELNQLGIKPKKSLGQNFLINEGSYSKIVSTLELRPGDTVIEVGPGLGMLTQFLAETGADVTAIEKDHRLMEFLKQKFKNQKNVTIVEDDILEFNPSNHLPQTTNYKLVGNIPYYLTSYLLRTIFEKWPPPKIIVLMLQKEVAQRVCAKPPKMNLLAVSVQYYAQPKIQSYVSSGSFYPPPEVDSAIIKLETRDQKTKNTPDNTKFFRIVKSGFAKKRKQLSNNLSGELKLEKRLVEEKLNSIGIDPKRRAETLTIEEWQNITTILLPY